MKKLTFLLSVVAWLMAMPVMAAVDDVFTFGNLKFKVITEDETKKEVQVIRPDAELSGDVVIPDHVTNNAVEYSVAYIKGGEIAEGCAFREMNDITSITIPYTVYSMEYSAFYHCEGLKYVFNNGNMNMVDGWTFNGCTSLEYCVVPATVLKIGQSAFEGCSALKDLTILGSVELDQHALKDCSALKSIYYCGSTLSLKPTSNEWQIFQNTDNPVIYTKSSALSTIIDALNGKADWIKDLATDEIPYIPAKQYTTFCRDFDVDFSAATGLKAGVATTDLNGTMLKLIVKTSIPAGTGVVLKKLNEGEYKLKIAEESPEAIVGNKLVGVVAPTAIPQTDGDNTNFVLKDGVFKKVSADNNTLPAGKAYLQLTTSSTTRSLSFSFEDDVTGIDTTTIQTQTEDGHCYNLAGLHVGNSTKGLYIINGKKVVVK
jgi:hypothetical protein